MVQEYDFDIEYVPGEENGIANAFSRLVDAKDLDKETIAFLIRAKFRSRSKRERGFKLSDEQLNLIKFNFLNDEVSHHGVDATVEKMKIPLLIFHK